jgi:hypothetical protein
MIDVALDQGPSPAVSPTAEPTVNTTTLEAGAARAGSTHLDSNATDQEPRHEASDLELAFGIIALLAWTFVFAVGVVFPSTPIRDALTGMGVIDSRGMILAYLSAFLLTYTVSNVAILCCISAWLGELGRRTRISGADNGVPYRRGDYMAAVMRGFLGYLAVLTGYVIIGSGVNAFVTPSPEQFVRLAAIVSLAGFLIGYNPEVFNRFASSVTDRIITERKADGSVTRRIESTTGVRATVQTGPASSLDSPEHADEPLNSTPGTNGREHGNVPNPDRG